MSDVVLSPQTIAVVGGLMTALVTAVISLCGVIAFLYRQVLRERDRLLDMQDARMIDLWRSLEEKDIRITTLESANERLQRLAVDATEGWKTSVSAERSRLPLGGGKS